MNTKRLFIILGIVALLVAAFYALNGYIYTEKQADFVVGQTVEAKGTVLAVDLEKATFDGPVVITLQPEQGQTVTISVPSMGLPLCAAYKAKNIGDVFLIKAGQQFEVRGTVGEDGSIVPCDSADHYLRPTPLVVSDFEGEADPSRMTLTMKPWNWVSASYNDGRQIKPLKADKFAITFGADGAFTAKTDCNSAGGKYAVGANKTITFSQIFSTKMFCEGSQENVFIGLLENTQSYHFTSKGELILDLKFDSGTVTFK